MTILRDMQEKNLENDFFYQIDEFLSESELGDNLSIIRADPCYSNYYYAYLNENINFFYEYIPIIKNFKKDDIVNMLINEQDEMFNLRFFRFLIFENISAENNKIIADISLYNIDYLYSLSASIGYKIDEDYQGKGIISRSIEKIIEFAFNNLKLNKLIAEVLPENYKSVKILKNQNFFFEGISRKNLQIANKWRDHLRFSLIRNI
jgi:ribosomal-protein-alanine N-acetyltransferase